MVTLLQEDLQSIYTKSALVEIDHLHYMNIRTLKTPRETAFPRIAAPPVLGKQQYTGKLLYRASAQTIRYGCPMSLMLLYNFLFRL